MLNYDDAVHLFKYNPSTGCVTWKNPPESSCYFKGDLVGYLTNGYYKIKLFEMHIYVHRLAWLLYYGRRPSEFIDHINGDRSDNRIINLREASNTENSWNSKMRKNNSSSVKGVCWCKSNKKWVARIRIDGKRKTLGYFSDLNEAKLAMEEARTKYHGEFSNDGLLPLVETGKNSKASHSRGFFVSGTLA
ncbi:HNH endonuclease [Xenorhabdus bovienii]|uniref:HNH endonuclease n=1 Tax=Xenorhabdus bovienii TaxID=40576 RepID=UPI00237D1A97|nr:HNH endonuclease [Xenorhabdus bovienii]